MSGNCTGFGKLTNRAGPLLKPVSDACSGVDYLPVAKLVTAGGNFNLCVNNGVADQAMIAFAESWLCAGGSNILINCDCM